MIPNWRREVWNLEDNQIRVLFEIFREILHDGNNMLMIFWTVHCPLVAQVCVGGKSYFYVWEIFITQPLIHIFLISKEETGCSLFPLSSAMLFCTCEQIWKCHTAEANYVPQNTTSAETHSDFRHCLATGLNFQSHCVF